MGITWMIDGQIVSKYEMDLYIVSLEEASEISSTCSYSSYYEELSERCLLTELDM